MFLLFPLPIATSNDCIIRLLRNLSILTNREHWNSVLIFRRRFGEFFYMEKNSHNPIAYINTESYSAENTKRKVILISKCRRFKKTLFNVVVAVMKLSFVFEEFDGWEANSWPQENYNCFWKIIQIYIYIYIKSRLNLSFTSLNWIIAFL